MSTWSSHSLEETMPSLESVDSLYDSFCISMGNNMKEQIWTLKNTRNTLPETKHSTWKWMVGILVSLWDGLCSGAMLVSVRVFIVIGLSSLFTTKDPSILGPTSHQYLFASIYIWTFKRTAQHLGIYFFLGNKIYIINSNQRHFEKTTQSNLLF